MLFWLLAAVQVFLSIVLLLAAVGKILQFEDFAALLDVSHLPNAAVRPLSIIIPSLEMCLAVGLLLTDGRLLRTVFGIATLLFLSFIGWMTWIGAHGLRVQCSCFGLGGNEVNSRSIARNLLLMLVSAGGLYLAKTTQSGLPGPSLWLAITVTSLSLGVALLLGFRAGFPSLVLTLDQLEQDQPLPSGAQGEG
ncbi:MAG: MauE/DoxX family redox-associated membrane protein [Thermomicrobiales bacterium]